MSKVTSQTKRRQFSYWTTDAAQYDAMKALAARRGVTLSALVTEALGAFLKTPPTPPATRTPQTTNTVSTSRQHPSSGDPLCIRCGHSMSQHWLKGCLAGCACHMGRFRD